MKQFSFFYNKSEIFMQYIFLLLLSSLTLSLFYAMEQDSHLSYFIRTGSYLYLNFENG